MGSVEVNRIGLHIFSGIYLQCGAFRLLLGLPVAGTQSHATPSLSTMNKSEEQWNESGISGRHGGLEPTGARRFLAPYSISGNSHRLVERSADAA